MYLAFAALLPLSVPCPNPPQDEVDALIIAARDGSNEAAGKLYELHVSAVYRTVRPLCRNDDEAEDTVQEAFARAFEALDRYEPRQGSRFISWLLTIALNVARKTLRRRKKMDVVADDTGHETSFDDVEPADERLDRLRTRKVLLSLLAELPERDREVLTLRYGGELGSAEVAAICKTSEANVRKICERQRRRLLERLDALQADSVRPVENQS